MVALSAPMRTLALLVVEPTDAAWIAVRRLRRDGAD